MDKNIGFRFSMADYLKHGQNLTRLTSLVSCPELADELFSDLLKMLGQYNFTVDESTPLDQIVGIDPEMLGKVLENLLEAEARHASGTYYTPRSIVAYMCRETLYRHLSAHLSRDGFNQLIETASTGDTAPLEPKLAKVLNDQLDQLKILDPAVGSGAFLLGMLQEILLLKESLARVKDETIQRATLKRHIIHNSLYAVDISFPAIEIARLRIKAQLTAMVETHWANKEKNIHEKLKNIDKRRVKGKISSQKLAKDYETCLNLLADITEQRTKLNQSRQADEELDLPFTPLHLYFADVFSGDNHGFDIVIANPPYVRQEQIKDIKPHLKEEFGKFFRGTADLYTYFYKRGLELLKTGGHLGFIAPNKFMRAGYGKNTRELLTTVATPEVIIDFGELPVFEAGTDPAIVLVEKTQANNSQSIDIAIIKDKAEIEQVAESVAKRGFTMQPSDLSHDGWTLESEDVLNLMKKLRKIGTPLGEYVQGRFYRGVLTGFNDAFVIDAATRDKLIAEDAKSAELIKPWLRGRDIRKWRVEWADLYVIFTRRGTDIEKYPAIKQHLEQFREDLEPKISSKQKKGRKPGSYKWFEIQDNIAYYAEFERAKIIYPDIATLMRGCYDTIGAFCANTLYILPTEDLYILAILHSSLFDWYARYEFQSLGDPWAGGRLRFFTQYMEKVPIFPATDTQKVPIIERVNTILTDPTAPDVRRLEK
ncbi:MAG: TaqI-like C-terminal specificity domain-containing protein [Pseudomonadota bacterium]